MPVPGSPTEKELRDVMQQYGTLESPFSYEYLRTLLDEQGLAIVGDYVSVNGLFEREMLAGNLLPLETLATDYHYLTCMKVTETGRAGDVPDSRKPGLLRAEFTEIEPLPTPVGPGAIWTIPLAIKNTGDTLWLSGQTVRAGVVMPALKVLDENDQIVSESHGQPMLPHAVPPGQTVVLEMQVSAPVVPGAYRLKIDLVDQHVCWFEACGSKPLVLGFTVA